MSIFYNMIVLEIIVLMTYLIIMVNANDLLSLNKRRLFKFLYSCIILAVIAEWTGTITIPYGEQFRQVHVWTKVVELSLTPLVPFVCAEILNSSDKIGRAKR